jgi:hypothetical protein
VEEEEKKNTGIKDLGAKIHGVELAATSVTRGAN